ncbi:kinase-like domain-containing protein [Roridomyces roridus]|uniref:Kinase-like domain-containing protein n=1 Tax=Roridomyces roridus TaxID=1738132 RepID=A0AAD7G3A6_9AGAR|nr:kinase-like domain-containing protein [Roridomyces roridus]
MPTNRLDQLFHDGMWYTSLSASAAQGLLNLFQDFLDHGVHLAPMERRRLFKALIQLCGQFKLLPGSFALADLEHEKLVAGGSLSDVYQGRLLGQRVVVKKVRVFDESDIDPKVSSCFPCLVLAWMENGRIRRFVKQEAYDTDRLLALRLHVNGVVHGDLKGDNILITPSFGACITDFGLAHTTTSTSSIAHPSYGCLQLCVYEVGASSFHMWVERLHVSPEQLFTGTAPFSELFLDTAVIFAVLDGRRPSLLPHAREPERLTGFEIVGTANPIAGGLPSKLLSACGAGISGL